MVSGGKNSLRRKDNIGVAGRHFAAGNLRARLHLLQREEVIIGVINPADLYKPNFAVAE
jgi:hypothetical protein